MDQIACHTCDKTIIGPGRPVETEYISLFESLAIKEHLVLCAIVSSYNGNLYEEWEPEYCDISTLEDNGHLTLAFRPLLQDSNGMYIDDYVACNTWPSYYYIERGSRRIHFPIVVNVEEAYRMTLDGMSVLKSAWGF